jgi:uncharacterized protein (TIGR03435 family)
MPPRSPHAFAHSDRQMKSLRLGWIALALATCIGAQTRTTQQARFEVASIRESAVTPGAEGSGRERIDISPTTVWLRNASLSFSIQWAYGVKFYQISGPGWLKDQRWDILAKTQAAHSEQEFRMMMRALLTERFKVMLHTEQQVRPVYALTVGKGKLKVERASAEEATGLRVVDGDFVFTGTTMAQFAEQLSDFATVDRPVLNETALTGPFDFKLESAARAVRGGDGPSIFTAVAEIGVQMKTANEAVEIVVVDSAEKQPTTN